MLFALKQFFTVRDTQQLSSASFRVGCDSLITKIQSKDAFLRMADDPGQYSGGGSIGQVGKFSGISVVIYKKCSGRKKGAGKACVAGKRRCSAQNNDRTQRDLPLQIIEYGLQCIVGFSGVFLADIIFVFGAVSVVAVKPFQGDSGKFRACLAEVRQIRKRNAGSVHPQIDICKNCGIAARRSCIMSKPRQHFQIVAYGIELRVRKCF